MRRFARALLTAGCEAFPGDERLARALLATADERTPVRRLAKQLLKRTPEVLPLWLVYAEAEASAGNAAEARRVCLSALTLCAPPKGRATIAELLPIAHAAAKRVLEAGGAEGGAASTADALRCLVCAFAPEAAACDVPSRPQVLVARRGLESEARRLLPPEACPPTCRSHAAEAVAEPHAEPIELDESRASLLCAFALFELLESGPLAALAIHEGAQAALVPSAAMAEPPSLPSATSASVPPRLLGAGSRAHERLIEHWHWLLARHAASRRPPPNRERSLYDATLTHFPANAPVLCTLAAGGLGSLGRFEVRRLLSAARVRHAECPQLWLCAARFELAGLNASPAQLAGGGDGGARGGRCEHGHEEATVRRTVPEGGTQRRVRSLFEGALRPAACSGCPALWRAYLQFEVGLGGREAACRLQLRAVQQCPGVKSLWCEAMRTPMVSFLPMEQLVDTIELMVSKEIRLRHEPPDPEHARVFEAPPESHTHS